MASVAFGIIIVINVINAVILRIILVMTIVISNLYAIVSALVACARGYD